MASIHNTLSEAWKWEIGAHLLTHGLQVSFGHYFWRLFGRKRHSIGSKDGVDLFTSGYWERTIDTIGVLERRLRDLSDDLDQLMIGLRVDVDGTQWMGHHRWHYGLAAKSSLSPDQESHEERQQDVIVGTREAEAKRAWSSGRMRRCQQLMALVSGTREA